MTYDPAELTVDAVTAAVSLDLLTATARLALQPGNIPDSLKSLPQWTCWRYADKASGKPTKPPIDAKTGRNASSKNPATWSTFDAALSRFNSDSTIAGLHIMLKPTDPIVAIDIDDYGYGDNPDPQAAATLATFTGTYAEHSPSGGLHIFAIGQCPGKPQQKTGIFEVRRTLTVTGDRIEGHEADLTEQQDAIDLYSRHCLTRPPEPEPEDDDDDMDMPDSLSSICPRCGATAEYPDCEACGYDFTAEQPDPTDTEKKPDHSAANDFSFVSVGSVDYARRLELALTNQTIAALYHGNNAAYGNNRSQGELALCVRLLTPADGRDDVITDWLNASGCGKWQERSKDTDVYRRNTLAAARRKWDGKPFEDKRQPDIDHGRELANGLLRGRENRETGGKQAGKEQAGQAGHTGTSPGHDPDNAGQTGHSGVSGSSLFIDAADLLLHIQPPKWLIKRFISADSLTTLFGSPGSGKSFIAIDMACCVASGLEWNGHRTATGQVLYIAGEGHVGFARRLTAWQAVHGAIPPNRLFVSIRSIAFNQIGLQAVIDEIENLSDVPGLIVLDTLATVIDGNENDAADMARFIRALKSMQVCTQAAVLVVHHTGHGDKTRARGHSSLNGAIDTELRIDRLEGAGTLSCTKQKDAEPPQPVGFELTQYAIGEDEDGDAITSCTVTYSVADGKPGKARELPASQKVALTALHTALVNEGGTYSGQFAVHIEAWRKAAYDGGIGHDPESKKKNFQNSRSKVLAAGHVLCREDLYWFADAGKQNSASLLNTEKRKQQATQADF